jgi:hypothetical protein
MPSIFARSHTIVAILPFWTMVMSCSEVVQGFLVSSVLNTEMRPGSVSHCVNVANVAFPEQVVPLNR